MMTYEGRRSSTASLSAATPERASSALRPSGCWFSELKPGHGGPAAKTSSPARLHSAALSATGPRLSSSSACVIAVRGVDMGASMSRSLSPRAALHTRSARAVSTRKALASPCPTRPFAADCGYSCLSTATWRESFSTNPTFAASASLPPSAPEASPPMPAKRSMMPKLLERAAPTSGAVHALAAASPGRSLGGRPSARGGSSAQRSYTHAGMSSSAAVSCSYNLHTTASTFLGSLESDAT